MLSGECLLLIEGQERRLRAWDFVHCPAWTEHVFVGAGTGPCAILAVGTRTDGGVVYPVSRTRAAPSRGRRARDQRPRAVLRRHYRRTSPRPTARAGSRADRGSASRPRPARARRTCRSGCSARQDREMGVGPAIDPSQPPSRRPPPSSAKNSAACAVRDAVGVGEDEQHRDREAAHLLGPVVGAAASAPPVLSISDRDRIEVGRDGGPRSNSGDWRICSRHRARRPAPSRRAPRGTSPRAGTAPRRRQAGARARGAGSRSAGSLRRPASTPRRSTLPRAEVCREAADVVAEALIGERARRVGRVAVALQLDRDDAPGRSELVEQAGEHRGRAEARRG